MSDRVLHEHLIEILLRLSVKDLVRCTEVCKPWHSLIKSPNFIKTHLTRTRSKSPQLLSIHHQYSIEQRNSVHDEHIYSGHICDETFKKIEDLNFPFEVGQEWDSFRIVGSCDGLVCLCTNASAALWNPSIRKIVNLPPHGFAAKDICAFRVVDVPPHGYAVEKLYAFYNVFGFGFDAKSSDYKVVRIAYRAYPTGMDPHEAELYSFKRGSWKSINGPNCNVVEFHTHAFTNGASHWISELNHLVVAFDMGVEAFREIMLPGNIPHDQHLPHDQEELMVAVFEDSLAVIHSFYIDYQHNTYSMWAMKEYGRPESWTKLFTIDLQRANISSIKVGDSTFFFPIIRRNSATEVGYYRESLALLDHDHDEEIIRKKEEKERA